MYGVRIGIYESARSSIQSRTHLCFKPLVFVPYASSNRAAHAYLGALYEASPKLNARYLRIICKPCNMHGFLVTEAVSNTQHNSPSI